MTPPLGARLIAAPASLASALVLVACGGGGPARSAEAFCGAITTHQVALVEPTLASELDIATTLDLYREVGRTAPLSIQEEWDAVVTNLETASTVVPSDPDSVQRAVAQAYATERSAAAVHDWLRDHCAIEFGPVGTIAPG
jgi:hypothetical protein